MQTWSGLPPAMVRDTFAAVRPKLVALRGPDGKELLDLPKAPRPGADTPVPVRFLPEFESLLLSHADRRRILADEHRRHVYLPALRVAGTFLVDGFVAGTLRFERKKDTATLVLEPFAALAKAVRDSLAEEGEALLGFAESDARNLEVRFARQRG